MKSKYNLSGNMGTPQITALVVEDNTANLKYMEFLLRKIEIVMIHAKSGEEALAMINDNDIDCFLIDINLGLGMTGIELAEALRQNEELNHTPIFAVTAYADDKFVNEMLEAGFNNYLSKPYNLQDLKKLLSEYLPISNK
jgi:CheY-like chemotaxis protein